MILDTSFLIDLMRKNPEALRLLETIEAGSEPLQVPAPVLYELWEGIERSTKPVREAEAVAELLDACSPVPLSPEAAKRAGRLSGNLGRRGQTLDDLDLLIAGIALESGGTVVTRDRRDFERVEGLQVLTY